MGQHTEVKTSKHNKNSLLIQTMQPMNQAECPQN